MRADLRTGRWQQLGVATVFVFYLFCSTVQAQAPIDAPPPPPRPQSPFAAAPTLQLAPATQPAAAQQIPTDPAPVPQSKPASPPKNMVCRDPRLQGIRKPNIVGKIPGCIVVEPVEIRQIAGIKLSGKVTLGCDTARAFANWVTGVVEPAAKGILGARVSSVTIYGSYSCRTRNSRAGAKLSEHAFGRAVDVAAVKLGNGRTITVLKDWGKGANGKFLKRIWKQACGPFKTVLGPNADRWHRDHLHLDTARRRSSYCR